MRIPRSYIENYSKALNVVSERARASLVDALSRIDYSADVAAIRDAVIAIMQPACGASSTMAARLAAEFYDGLRARFDVDDGFAAEVDSQRVPEATDGAVRAFAQDLVDDKPVEQFIGKCADRIDYETRLAANKCIEFNAKNDLKKPRWARVPTGAETCQFCIMLASRGFVYHSEETASHAHAHCDCRVVPSWDKKNPAVQGYDPDEYYDMWKHPEKNEQTSNGQSLVGELPTVDAAPRNIKHIVDNYIGGSADEGTYKTYQIAAQERYGFKSPWTETVDRELVAKSMNATERKLGKELGDYVENLPVSSVELVRTNWDGGRAIPKKGDIVSWRLTSTSKDADFAHNVAKESVEGLQTIGDMTLSGERVKPKYETDETLVAFHFSKSHALDVSSVGEKFGFERQSEVLVSGRFVVDDVVDEAFDTGIRTTEPVYLTPRQYAERNGLEIVRFTSKKGKDMIRFGDDVTTARPANQIDMPQNAFADYGNYTVIIHHVYLNLSE